MPKRTKVVFDASPLLVNKTGVAYYIERLIEQAAKRYPDIEFVGFYYNFLGRRSTKHFPKAPNIRYRAVRFIPSKVVYQLRRWGVSPPLELLTKERADFALFGNFWGYPSLYRTPAAPVIHDLTYLDLPEYVADKNRKDLTRLVPKQIKRSDFVITVSEFSKQKIADIYKVTADNILVTPIPPSSPAHYPKSECQKELKQLGITKPFILFLSTIEPRKNLTNLIDAYEQLPEKLRTAYQLVVVGRVGWNCERELARIEKAKKDGLDVVYAGYVTDQAKAALYQSAALYTNTSHYEGFGMPVLEAMSYGVPCAVSDIPVFHEVAGNTARYFKQADPADICKTFVGMLDKNTLSKLGTQSKQRATSFRWDTIAESVVARIKQSVERG